MRVSVLGLILTHSQFPLTLLGIRLKIAMKRMATSNVLVVGMKGLGVEIGKILWSEYTFPGT
jgi:molybdopterin/thiamine biosynthesis adenylyltransferase